MVVLNYRAICLKIYLIRAFEQLIEADIESGVDMIKK